MPPSLLATALVLQAYDGVSDDEAKQRADYDLRWKVALGIELEVRPFAKSTLQEFRAQLIVHEQTLALFQRTLDIIGPKRLLFGSDSSFFPRGWHYKVFDDQARALHELRWPVGDARAIFGENLLRIMAR